MAAVALSLLVFVFLWACSRAAAWDLASVLGKLAEGVIAPVAWPAVAGLVALLAYDAGVFHEFAGRLRFLLRASAFGAELAFAEEADRLGYATPAEAGRGGDRPAPADHRSC